jgi:hypothetical protein
MFQLYNSREICYSDRMKINDHDDLANLLLGRLVEQMKGNK